MIPPFAHGCAEKLIGKGRGPTSRLLIRDYEFWMFGRVGIGTGTEIPVIINHFILQAYHKAIIPGTFHGDDKIFYVNINQIKR